PSSTGAPPQTGSERTARRRAVKLNGSFYVRRLEDRHVLSVGVVPTQTFTVAENSAAGTTGGTVQTTPQADPSQPLTFSSVDGNPSNAFLIKPNSGEVQVANPDALDFESTPEFQLTIGVAQQGDDGPQSTGTITIKLTDVYAPASVQLTGGDATL